MDQGGAAFPIVELAADPYPGAVSGAADTLNLAHRFRQAAISLTPEDRTLRLALRAPYRLVALQAIELYFNALLLHGGVAPPRIRAMQHDLAARAHLAQECGMQLRRRTLAHIQSVTARREYLATRYDPLAVSGLTPCNRMAASLDEVAAKATRLVATTAQTHRPIAGSPGFLRPTEGLNYGR